MAFHAEIYDASGRRVRRLASGVRRGEVMLVWDGRDEEGRVARAGLYFLRVSTGAAQLERRFARVR
jgi:flagellar hook assembly protein FlgD